MSEKGLGVGESLSSTTCRVCYGKDYPEARKSETGKIVVRENVAFNMTMTKANVEMNSFEGESCVETQSTLIIVKWKVWL